MNGSDERLKLLSGFEDNRINFVCLDHPDFLEHIDSFDGESEEKLEEGLETFVSEIIEAKVSIDEEEGEIIFPKVLETYKSDFGGTDEGILQFVFKYLEEEHDYDSILKQVQNKSIII